MKPEISYLDLFSGIGGFALGLLQAGFVFAHHYFSEVDLYATANYQYHFPKAKPLGDITRIKGKALKRIDCITFGSPCQDVSLIGKRKGLKGNRSNLFFEAVRLIKECLPSAFVFENVKGLFSSNKGKDFETVLKAFADLGLYNCQWQLLNTSWFLPQHRERVYLVGTLAKKDTPKIFPFTQDHFASEKTGTKEIIVPALNCSAGQLTNHDTYVQLKTANSLRRLTPIECERLQGFPDNWTQYGIIQGRINEIKETPRYQMLGNAVSVPVVKAVSSRLIH